MIYLLQYVTWLIVVVHAWSCMYSFNVCVSFLKLTTHIVCSDFFFRDWNHHFLRMKLAAYHNDDIRLSIRPAKMTSTDWLKFNSQKPHLTTLTLQRGHFHPWTWSTWCWPPRRSLASRSRVDEGWPHAAGSSPGKTPGEHDTNSLDSWV